MPMMSSPRIRLEAASPGTRKTRSGMIGAGAVLERTNATRRTAARAPKPSVCVEPQPWVLAVTIA